MKFSFVLRLAALAALIFSTNLRAADNSTDTAASPREHLSLDAQWKFHLGDNWPNALDLVKACESGGPASEKFDDKAWRTVDLPHDWVIELPFDKTADKAHGYKPVGPKFPTNSIGWYRRTFEVPKSDEGKRLWLTFDGVFRDATVWVNGWIVRHHEGGYYPFREDITDILHYGGTNLITVKVDASKFEGWFYEGAGIYRHVWLDKTAPVAIAPDGIAVWIEFNNNSPSGSAMVYTSTELLNETTNGYRRTLITRSVNNEAVLKYAIVDPRGKTNFLENNIPSQTVAHLSGKNAEVFALIEINSPILWSPENPNLYKLITTVSVDGKVTDRKETEFGIRTFAFDKDKGFLLNGKPYPLYGACNHQDHAGVGAALPDALQYFRVKKLKEFGCNAYRTSHNPPTPELLEACDRLGMLVMDENRLLGSDSENLRKWEDLIRRDRNHASVAIWSLCNEEYAVERRVDGGRVGLTMQRLVKQLDPTRPVTAAEDVANEYKGLMSALEVRGWNYRIGGMDAYHAEHPDQPNVGSEQASTLCTRGIYTKDKEHGYVSAYDENAPKWANTTEYWWSFFAVRPWLSGGFIWTGFDYRGEPTPYAWPCINSHFGVLDTCGFRKDNAWYYESWWTTNTVLHLLPHWNWAGKEGQEIRVDALSNCKAVELFLNGASLGKQTMKPNSKLTWKVKYASGTLSAKGFDASDKVIKETSVETTGEPAAVQLVPDRSTINADGADLSIITVAVADAKGRIVPTAGNKISFAIEGAGKILGVGNGDPSCHEPDTIYAVGATNWSRSVFNGLAQIIVQSTKAAGEIKLTATADGLTPTTVAIATQSGNGRPSLP